MKISVLYFLEDRAHENFLTALVERIAEEMGFVTQHDVRNAVRGDNIVNELDIFIRSIEDFTNIDVIIIARDGDGKKYSDRVKEIKNIFNKLDNALIDYFERVVVFCIPDPYIERWYCSDLNALKKIVGRRIEIKQPKYSNDKSYYKILLRDVFKQIGSQLGGIEYGDEIAQEINLDRLEKVNANFGKFIKDLRTALKRKLIDLKSRDYE